MNRDNAFNDLPMSLINTRHSSEINKPGCHQRFHVPSVPYLDRGTRAGAAHATTIYMLFRHSQ